MAARKAKVVAKDRSEGARKKLIERRGGGKPTKTFEQLNPKEKDELLKTLALRAGLVAESK